MNKVKVNGGLLAQLRTWRGELEELPLARLRRVARAADRWFETEVASRADMTRKQLVDHVMGMDPLFVEGGLGDFLRSERVVA